MKKHTFYIGLNDKDTKTQKISTLEAYKVTMNLIGDKFGGGTVYEGNGFYKHEDGQVVIEKSLIAITYTDKETKDFINTLKVLFNQESILHEVEQTNITFE